MIIRLIIFCLSFIIPVFAQDNLSHYLPKDAQIIEEISLTTNGYPQRSIILWMINPEAHPSNYKADDIYTCPDLTRGSYFSGPTRVSLVDNISNKIINTLEIRQEYNDGLDTFDIPFAIRKGYYYRVNGKSEKLKEIKPQILWLKDYNGDGKALEFVLFDAISCMGLETTLIGYSPLQDKVVQYPIKLEVYDEEQYVQESHWADYLFSKKPLKRGYWKYEVDYRGRGGFLCKYEVQFNKKTDTFEGKLIYQH